MVAEIVTALAIVQLCLLTEILVVGEQLDSENGYFQFMSQVKLRTSPF